MINTSNPFNAFTAQEIHEIREHYKRSPVQVLPRFVPEDIANGPDDGLVEFLSTPETLEELRTRYAQFPTAQHLSAALSLGRLPLDKNTTRLLSYWVDHWATAPADLLATPGLGRIRAALTHREREARNVLPELPSMETIRTLWMLDPTSPTGLASVRIGKALKGEARNGTLNVTYRAPGKPKVLYACGSLVAALESDLGAAELDLIERQRLARIAQLKEERRAVTMIEQHELDAINEAFPRCARMSLIAARSLYSHKACEFRHWDSEAQRVYFDESALLAHARTHINSRFVERLESVLAQGISMASILCSRLRIPLGHGTLMFQDPPRQPIKTDPE
ncbi:hypothetical protein [Pseudomonas soli]|uniref:hypothetical protein n=1 Tax=Pseudomonas soli TaxID=1306993 RepID=UPI00345DB024